MTDADDGWGVSDEYSIDSFYTRATDGRGHSDNMRVRLKPEIAGEIGALVSSGVIPEYDTSQAFIRDAIVHRLRWVAENIANPQLAARLAETIRRNAIEETTSKFVEMVDSFEEFMTRTREVCDRALRWGDHAGVAVYLREVVEYASNTREPYSSMLMQVVEHFQDQLKVQDELPADIPLDGGVGPEEAA